MEEFIFRFFAYAMAGFFLEVTFSVIGIEFCLGKKLKKQTPHKYLEGFVSLYMIPIHGLGMYFGFEFQHSQIAELNIFVRYLIWCLSITSVEALSGFIMHRTIGFYPWDYYKDSKYKVFENGYTLWSLIPLWGIAGLILEQYSRLLIYLSPIVQNYFGS